MRRPAFTLVELLIAVAISATLAALMVPAVVRVRAAAEATACRSNLRQVALALLGHHDRAGRFPSGMTRHDPPNGLPRPPAPYDDHYRYCGFWPWSVFILPELEQGVVFARIDWRSFPWHQPVGATPMPVYRCPSDVHVGRHYSLGGHAVALTSYLGTTGTDQYAQNGVLTVNGRVRVTDVVDGTSHTAVVGERPPAANAWFGWWAGGMGEAPHRLGTSDTLLGVAERRLPADPPAEFRAGSLNDPTYQHLRHYWSFHPGGAHFAFADGSVRLLQYGQSINALATRSGAD
jgi:prepilin-type N-terminal cleavage/methylation domain-containing protein/prepilin-type processing-associated H-X9-DG protein